MKFEHTSDTNLKIHPVSRVYYYVKGAFQRSLKTKDPKEAKRRMKIIEAEREFAGTAAMRLKVGEVFPEYLKEKRDQRDGKLAKKKVISPGTYREIDNLSRLHLLPYFGKKTLAGVDTLTWIKYCDQSKVSDLANHRKVMTGFLKWCKTKGHLTSMPDITSIPNHERRQRRIIRPNELRDIFKSAQGSLRTFLSLALFNGLRRTEIMTLTWDRISLKERFLVVDKRFNKKRRGRSIPINEILVTVLAEHREKQLAAGVKSPWVFPNARDPRRHAHVDGLKTAWHTCLKNAELADEDITWHDFRATFEKYAHKSTAHTDTQREKFADATIEVQKRIYVNMDHEDLRGLENSVSVPGLPQIIQNQTPSMGKLGEDE